MLLWLRLRLLLHELLPSGPASCNPARKTKHYAGGSPLVEQEGWLANDSYTNDTPHLATGFHLHNRAKKNQGVIRAFLERVALNQVRLIDHNIGLLNERNGVPV